MPSERFFYRPPDPGYGSLGAGLASGLSSGVANYYDEKDRRAEQERQRLEDERRRRREDAEDAFLAAQREAGFIQAGGGMGPRPIPEYSRLDFGRLGLADTEAARNSLTEPVQLGPQGPGIVQRAAEDPNFRQYRTLGDNYAYIEDPEARARRLAGDERAMAEYEAGVRRSQIADALTAFRGGTPQETMGAASLIAGDVADFGDLYPDRWYPRTQEEAQNQYLFEQNNKRFAPRAAGGGSTTDRGLPTFTQIFDDLKDEYWDPDTGDYSIPLDEIYSMAQEMARGRAGWPSREEKRGLAPGSPFAPVSFEEWASQFGGGNVAPTAELSPEDIADVKAQLQNIPEDEWVTALTGAGYSRSEINQILGR